MTQPYRAALIGLGKIGVGFAQDKKFAKHYAYSTHAQALRDHPRFNWVAGADKNEEALGEFQRHWDVPYAVHDLHELERLDIEFAVIATPPSHRLEILSYLPRLKGLLVEKPLGETEESTNLFIQAVESRGIPCQVALWRRFDETFRRWAEGEMAELVGEVQAVFATYGNGFRNNGTHVIDFIRMLFGEISEFSVIPGGRVTTAGPIPGDPQIDVALRMSSGCPVMVSSLDFEHYREVGLDVWGTRGRISVTQEGLVIRHYPLVESRSTDFNFEIASDHPAIIESSVGRAYYNMINNVAHVLDGTAEPACSLIEAHKTSNLVEEIILAAERSQ